jgi:hypothetical protein
MEGVLAAVSPANGTRFRDSFAIRTNIPYATQ